MNVHHTHSLFYEQDEKNCFLYEDNCLSIEINEENESERLKSLNA